MSDLKERKLPGEPQPLDEFIKRWEWRWRWQRLSADELHEMLSAMYRWRIELDCGCIVERYTEGPDADSVDELAEISDTVLTTGVTWFQLPPGSLTCRMESDQDCPRYTGDVPLRDIVTWQHRQPEVITSRRQVINGVVIEKHQYVWWDVVLSCGHPTRTTALPDWRPEDGPTARAVPMSPARGDKLRSSCVERGEASEDAEATVRHFELGCPRPRTFDQCSACGRSRSMVGYERVGWMVPPPPPPLPPPPDPRIALRKQLEREAAKAEKAAAQAARLRAELDALDG